MLLSLLHDPMYGIARHSSKNAACLAALLAWGVYAAASPGLGTHMLDMIAF